MSRGELEWATSYNAYERLADSPAALERLLQPAMAEYEATRRVPDWCGVDLLRGWAFYRQREHYFQGGGRMSRDWDDVLEAIRRHPAVQKRDLPPGR